jgi:hypothetical protein
METIVKVHKLVQIAGSLEESHRVADQPGRHPFPPPPVTSAFTVLSALSLLSMDTDVRHI